MSRNKIYIVITGQIASGKSALSDMLRKRSQDYLVVDADDQINDLYRRGAVLYKVLVNEFGSNILNEKQNISKAKLREFVLLNEENRKRLNALTHPVILKNMVNIAKDSDAKVVFFQIPLLNESIEYLGKMINIAEVWNISSDYNIRLQRLLQRKGMTEDIAKRIMAVQSEFENDDYDVLTVENNGSLAEFEQKIDLFIANGVLAKTQKRGFFGRKKKEEVYEIKEEQKGEVIESVEPEIPVIPVAPVIPEPISESSNPYKNIFEETKKEDNFLETSSDDEAETKREEIKFFNDDNATTKVINMENADFSSCERENINEKDEQMDDGLSNMLSSLNVINEENQEKKDDTFASLFEEDKAIEKEDYDSEILNSKIFKNEKSEIEDMVSNYEEDEYEEVEEENPKRKGKKKKKKMKIWKKILITIVALSLLCLSLFFGAIAYGGKNYSLNYLEEIQKYSAEYRVDPKVVLAIMKVESDFNPNAESHANAKGLMQIVPETAKHVAKLLQVDVNTVDLNDPETSVKFGTYYLRYLMNNYNELNTVYAAYNGGLGNVNNWLKDEKYSTNGTTLHNIPVEETKNYVVKVNKALKAYEILYGKDFPTKKTKGFAKFIENTKNTLAYIFRSF